MRSIFRVDSCLEWCIPCVCEKENVYYLYDNTSFKNIEYEYIIREEDSSFFKILFQCYRPLNLSLQPPNKEEPLKDAEKEDIYQNNLIMKWIPPLASAKRGC